MITSMMQQQSQAAHERTGIYRLQQAKMSQEGVLVHIVSDIMVEVKLYRSIQVLTRSPQLEQHRDSRPGALAVHAACSECPCWCG